MLFLNSDDVVGFFPLCVSKPKINFLLQVPMKLVTFVLTNGNALCLVVNVSLNHKRHSEGENNLLPCIKWYNINKITIVLHDKWLFLQQKDWFSSCVAVLTLAVNTAAALYQWSYMLSCNEDVLLCCREWSSCGLLCSETSRRRQLRTGHLQRQEDKPDQRYSWSVFINQLWTFQL